MNNYGFKSVLKDELYNFIQFKKSLGYKYDSPITICKKIDNFWSELNCSNIEMNKEDVMKFAKRLENENINYHSQRLYLLKNFSLFLVQQGYQNIYVYEYPIKQNKYQYIPYIYTDDDVITFFKGIKNSRLYEKEKYIMIFQLLYCTGMRLSEVTHIKLKDVNFKQKTIMITNGKNNNIRLIALSPTIFNILGEYLSKRFIGEEDYIFQTKNKSFISNSHLELVFRKIVNNYKIGENSINKPRIHDFRHTFAVKTLDKMYEKGYDYFTSLPLLSKYMGHSDITHTEYYLRLTKYYHHKVTDNEANLIPEVEL